MAHKFSEARLRKLWADPKVSREQIAAEFGYSPRWISKFVRDLGLNPRWGHPPIVEVDSQLIKAKWKQGLPEREIAELAGCSRATVARRAREMGLKRRKRSAVKSRLEGK